MWLTLGVLFRVRGACSFPFFQCLFGFLILPSPQCIRVVEGDEGCGLCDEVGQFIIIGTRIIGADSCPKPLERGCASAHAVAPEGLYDGARRHYYGEHSWCLTVSTSSRLLVPKWGKGELLGGVEVVEATPGLEVPSSKPGGALADCLEGLPPPLPWVLLPKHKEGGLPDAVGPIGRGYLGAQLWQPPTFSSRGDRSRGGRSR